MKRILISGLLIYLGFGLYLYLVQRSFIYFPVQEGGSGYDQSVFTNDGHTIKATVLNRGKTKAILYFGGNAENVDYNAATFSQALSDYTIFLIKYRGYGGSSGAPTEAGIYADALHIYEAVHEAYDQVSVIGRSLGSAVATHVAAKRDVHKLVLITPFDSIQQIAQAQIPLYPMSILLTDKHDSYSRASHIQAQTLVIAAENDRVIDMRHTRRLVDAFAAEVQMHIIEGMGHNNISDDPNYLRLLQEFL